MIKRKTTLSNIILLGLFVLNIIFWNYSRQFKPVLEIVPDPPSALTANAFALGDNQFYFRRLAFSLQNAGDTFGRFTALREYDFTKLYNWFTMLDSLDAKSNFTPSIAAYYFSQTQNTPDVKYVVDYLVNHSLNDLYNKWWWLAQAVYLTNHKLKDKPKALELAYKLAKTPNPKVPMWVRQMPAFIHEQLGEFEQSYIIIKDLAENSDNLEPGELNFMRYFLEERINKMKEAQELFETRQKEMREKNAN